MYDLNLFNLICNIIGLFVFMVSIIIEIKLFKLLKHDKNKIKWVIVICFTIFFTLGYIIDIISIIFSFVFLRDIMIGFVYLFGSLFVLGVFIIALNIQKHLVEKNYNLEEQINEKIEEIKNSRENFLTLIEKSFLGVIIIQDNLVKYVNKTALEILEIDFNKIKSYTINKLFSFLFSEDIPYANKRFRRFFIKNSHKEKDEDQIYKIKTGLNTIKWVKVYSKLIKYDKKDAIYVSFLDITQIKNIDDKIKESEKKFHDLVSSAPISILEIDLKNFNISYINEAFTNLLGYTCNDLKDFSFLKYIIYPEDYRNFFIKKKRNKINNLTHIKKQIIFRVYDRYGSLKWVEGTGILNYKDNKPYKFRLWIQNITNRIFVETELKRSEEKYRLITENANELIAVLNYRWEYDYVNNLTFYKKTGYDEKDIISKKFSDFIYEKDLEPFYKLKKEFLKNNKLKIKFRFKKKDGGIIWLESIGRKYKDSHGFEKILIISRDITKQKIFQDKIDSLNQELNLILDSVPIHIFYKDTQNRFIRVNKYLADALKMNKEDFIGKSCFELFPYEIAQEYWNDDLEVIKENKPKINYEELLITEEGPQWVLTSKIPITNDENKVIGIIGIALDITEQKKIQEELIESKIALKENEEKFRSISNYAGDAIILIDNDGNVSYWNKSAEKIFGYSIDEIIGKELHYVLAPSKYHESYKMNFKNFKETGKGSAIGKTLELEGVRKNGKIFPIELSVTSIKLKNKWCAIGIVRDITERKQNEEKIKNLLEKVRSQNEELKKLDKIKDEFFTDVAHEFRTPLISIKGFSELLLKSRNLSVIEKDDVNTIYRNAKKLERLIEEILNYSRLKANVAKFKNNKFKISTIIGILRKDFQIELNKKKLKLETIYKPDLEVILDQEQIMRLLRNLISNAIKFSRLGSKIVVVSEIIDHKWICSVKDYGIGIKKEDLSKIFSRYGKLYNKEYNPKGVGIGLTICKKIVEAYNGKIWVESDGVGKGAKFSFEIPLKEVQIAVAV